MTKIYKMNDGEFSFHSAMYGSWANDQCIIFRVRKDNNPKKRAQEKGIKNFDRIVTAGIYEINLWLKDHPNYHIKETVQASKGS